MQIDGNVVVSPLKSIMNDHIEEMEELGFPSNIVSITNDVLQLISDAKYKLVFRAAEDFLDAKFQDILKDKVFALHNCEFTFAFRWTNKFSVEIYIVRCPVKVSQANCN